MSFQSLQWLFPVVVTLHNAEEAAWFPDWSKRAKHWFVPVEPGVFRFTAATLTALAFAVTWLSVRSGKQTFWTYLFFGYLTAMLVNALIPHVAVTLAERRYMPGVATAVFLNLPVLSMLSVSALKEGYVSGWKSAAYGAGVGGILLLSIRTLFKLGKLFGLGSRRIAK
jgi:hypothetical protein